MRFKDVQLQNFRNHTETALKCSDEQNLFLGNNGEGKTNILEAISYLCLTKSFYSSSDAIAVQLGQPGFMVSANAVSDADVSYDIDVRYNRESREKRIAINKGFVENKASVIGMFPVVVLSPENSAVTSGTPSNRRRFIDIVISQSSKAYLEDLIEYRRILRQRNRLLFEAKATQQDHADLLELWNENLVKRGSQISLRRSQFVNEFKPYLADAFRKMAGGREEPEICYDSSIKMDGGMSAEQTQGLFRRELEQQQSEERKLGTTLVGPHKDELVFEINGLGLKSFASQGQHKTFLVALKVAEFFYLRERCKETPVLLLDDVFSELDELRSEKLLSLTAELGQTFITATDERRFLAHAGQGGHVAKFFVNQGSVSLAKPTTLTN